MKDSITRREFLNGASVAVGASLLGGRATRGNEHAERIYPPAQTGLRGSHPGSWETMHARVAGRTWPTRPADETHDLVVVGGGISGLSAAAFYRSRNPDARILILDNHDDVGGHAKRNEFRVGGRTLIGYGGTESIDTPGSYSGVSLGLLADLGVDLQRFYDYYDQDLYNSLKLSHAIAFDGASFEASRLVTGYGSSPWRDFAARSPLSPRARADLVRAFEERRDYLPGMTEAEKIDLLGRISYRRYLEKYVGVDSQVLSLYQRWGMSYWCVGMDEVPALDILGYGDGGDLPGLGATLARQGGRSAEPYIFHFPDGNASIARLLVRRLNPAAVPGKTMEDVVTARLDYSTLDTPGLPVRIRLNATAVNVAHTPSQDAVDVTYVSAGQARTVRSSHCILACYNSAIPYLCPELPEEQRRGLQQAVKAPLVYTKVAVPHWRWFAELGTRYVYYTNGFYKQVELDYPVSMGDYHFGASPDDPMVLHLCHVPYFADIQGPEQWRAGRRQMLETDFSSFERHVREQLDEALGGAGFDADRDIAAITVNRWSHGYAYNPDLLWQPGSDGDTPWLDGRKPFGRITIANSDAGASADTDTAITEAHRAVGELWR